MNFEPINENPWYLKVLSQIKAVDKAKKDMEHNFDPTMRPKYDGIIKEEAADAAELLKLGASYTVTDKFVNITVDDETFEIDKEQLKSELGIDQYNLLVNHGEETREESEMSDVNDADDHVGYADNDKMPSSVAPLMMMRQVIDQTMSAYTGKPVINYPAVASNIKSKSLAEILKNISELQQQVINIEEEKAKALNASSLGNEKDRQKIESLNKELENKQQELEEASEKIDDLTRQLNEKDARIDELSSAISKQNESLSETAKRLEEAEAHSKEKDAKINNFSNLLSANKSDSDSLRRKIQELQDVLSEKAKEIEHKNSALSDKDRSLENNSEKLKRQSDELEKKNAELSSRDGQLQQKSNELEARTRELESKKNELAQKENELHQKTAQINSKDNLIKQKDEEIAQKSAEIEQKTKELESKKNELAQKISELKRKEDESRNNENAIKSAEEAKNRALTEKKTAESEKDRAVARKDQEISELKSKISSLEDKVSSLSGKQLSSDDRDKLNKYNSLDNKVRSLQKQLDSAKREQKDLEARNSELEDVAYKDQLTGFYNDKALDKDLENKDYNGLVIARIGICGMKEINSINGYKAGDQVIGYVAQKLDDGIRDDGSIYRTMGDQFVVLGNNTDIEKKLEEIDNSLKAENVHIAYGIVEKDRERGQDSHKLYAIAADKMNSMKNRIYSEMSNDTPVQRSNTDDRQTADASREDNSSVSYDDDDELTEDESFSQEIMDTISNNEEGR